MQSAERVSHRDQSDNYVFQRSILAYHKAAEIVSGRVLEIGTGSGYGIEIISPKAESYMTIDKFDANIDTSEYSNVEFHKMVVPPLKGIASSSLDYVISFQVIEHIKDDFEFVREVRRVLKPGGRFIVSTPNRYMSLTRNPWHVREYSPGEFKNFIGGFFSKVEALGVFGNEKVMEYYHNNKRSVERIMSFDVLHLVKIAPRWLLKIPYDIMNRINRRRLLDSNRELTVSIGMEDYCFKKVDDGCFDLFFIAEK